MKAAKQPAGNRLGGEIQNRQPRTSIQYIIARQDEACKAMALFTNVVAEVAAQTRDGQLVKVALFANRTTGEWHCLSDILSIVLQLALVAVSRVGEP